MVKKTLLIVDDDEMLRAQLSRALVSRGLQVMTAATCHEACQQLKAFPDLAVIDLKMPGESGLEVLKQLGQRSPQTKSIVLTGYGSIANAVEAMKLGAVNYVTKPADADQILDALASAETDQIDSEAAKLSRPSLAESQWNHIQRVLADCGGNVTHAARVLDIPRRTLQRKLKKRAP